MTDFGMCMRMGDLAEEGYGDAVDDPGMAACCLREISDQKKASAHLKRLQAVDPTRIAVERHAKVVSNRAFYMSKTSDAKQVEHHHHHDSCGCDGHHGPKEVTKTDETLDETLDDEDDDDFDSEDELEMLRQLRISRLTQAQHAIEPQINSRTLVEEITSEKQLNSYTNELTPLVCILYSEESIELTELIVKECESYAKVNNTVKFVKIDLEEATTNIVIKALGGKTSSSINAPSLSMFVNGNCKTIIQRKELEQKARVNGEWIKYMLRQYIGLDIPSSTENESDDDDGDLRVEQYCNKPGCGRSFPHEHVTGATTFDGIFG